MECKKCGALLEEGQTLCPECGEPVKEKKPRKPLGKKAIISIICVALVVVLLASIAATVLFTLEPWEKSVYNKDNYVVSEFWSEQTAEWVVATMGDYELTNRRLQVFFWMQVYDLMEYYTEQYGDYAAYYLNLDPSKPLSEQVYDKETGMTWEQFFLEEALFTWHRYQALTDEAQKAGYQMPEEYQKEFEGLYASMEESAKKSLFPTVDDMLQADLGKTVTFEDYRYYMELYYTANLYFTDVTSKLTFTDAELDTYFEENKEMLSEYGIAKDDDKLVDYRKILVKPVSSKDEDGKSVITEQAWADCQTKAQEILNTWQSGEKTEDSFGKLATEKSEETSSASNGGLYRYVARNELATVDVRHILIMPEGGTKDENGNTTYSEAEWETCRAAAQALLDQYLAGDKTAEAFGALANEHSDDNNGNVTNGGLYSNVYSGQMVAEFDQWIFDASRKTGDTGLVKTQFGYHVMYFVERKGPVDAWLFADGRQTGDTSIIKTNTGYEIIYYVSDQLEWKAYAQEGLSSKTSEDYMQSCADAHPVEVRHWAIMFSELVKNG